ncbi:MAG: cysteine--tRNA ligase, partial [Puniceicoccaceae bacterium]|nr:cysteine--tRNA ligase [Puniceicoccaceae bacterium]
NFTFDSMQASRKALSKLTDFAKKFGIEPSRSSTLETEFGPFYPVQEALLSDLNTPEALGRWFRLVREMGEARDRGEFDGNVEELEMLRKGFQATCDALGLIIKVKEEVVEEVPKEIHELAQNRWEAKLNKDWTAADQIRENLLQKGWAVKDSKDGFELAKA